MANEKVALTVKTGAKCAVCHKGLSIKFVKVKASIAEFSLECATCPARVTIAGGEDAHISIEATDEQAESSFKPLTDMLAEIDAADDADFGLLLIGVRDAARFELGRDDMSLLEAANIVGQRGYTVKITDAGIGWVTKRDG